jgi:hypothetical protein
MQRDETIYLLIRNGRAMQDLPVVPDILDVSPPPNAWNPSAGAGGTRTRRQDKTPAIAKVAIPSMVTT